MKKIILLLIVSILVIYGCSIFRIPEIKVLSHTEVNMLGTLINMKFYVKDEKFNSNNINKLVKKMKDLEKVFSPTILTSTLSILNKERKLNLNDRNSNLLSQVLKKSSRIMEFSDGCFNPFMGTLIKKWGFFSDFNILSSEVVAQEVQKIKDSSIVFGNNILSLTGEAELNLGGIAKGYIVDLIVSDCKKNSSLFGGIIDAGGDIVVFGGKGNGKPFTVGIRKPVMGGGILEVLSIKGEDHSAVATSGDYERFFLVGEKKYHHLLDPETGYPKETEISSVTVLSSSLVLSDSLATAIFVGGEKFIVKLKEKYKFEYFIIKKDGKMICSETAKKLIK